MSIFVYRFKKIDAEFTFRPGRFKKFLILKANVHLGNNKKKNKQKQKHALV